MDVMSGNIISTVYVHVLHVTADRYRVILNDHPNYVHAVFAPVSETYS